MTILLTYSLLILLFLSGIFGLFLVKEYIKKISCLSVSYLSFIVLMILFSTHSANQNNILLLLISVIITFAVNLVIGISIAKNINEQKR